MTSSLLVFSLGAAVSGGKPQTDGQTAAAQEKASVIAAKQTASVEKMNAAIDKQKAAANAQLGLAAPSAGSFFTAAWNTPMSITPPVLNPVCPAMAESELKPLIAQSAQAQSVEPAVIRAVIKRESAAFPCAVSEKGATGLMQLMPDVADQFGADPLDPKQNIEAGTKYLKQLLSRYKGDLKLALAAYNAGPQRVDADKKVPDIPETVAYVDAILKDLKTNTPAQK